VKRLQPDVALYPTPLFHVPREPGGVPSVAIAHNLLPFDLRELATYGARRLTAFSVLSRVRHASLFRRAHSVIFLSRYAMGKILRAVSHIANPVVVYHGLDECFRTPPPEPRPLGKRVEILYVSSIFLYKHQWDVVKAVSILRERLKLDIRLTLIGEGEPVALSKLLRCIADLDAGSYVEMVGSVPYKDLPEKYRSADIFVYASSCETFGLSLLEAMGSGLPVASSNRGPMSEILRDAGEYFRPDDPASIAAAIQVLIENPTRRHDCARMAHDYSGPFTWERCCEQTFAVLRSAADGGRSACRGPVQ
jgi:glycosyltransferase involved in cell wall biosynthesis